MMAVEDSAVDVDVQHFDRVGWTITARHLLPAVAPPTPPPLAPAPPAAPVLLAPAVPTVTTDDVEPTKVPGGPHSSSHSVSAQVASDV
jgi:hypothetical protein